MRQIDILPHWSKTFGWKWRNCTKFNIKNIKSISIPFSLALTLFLNIYTFPSFVIYFTVNVCLCVYCVSVWIVCIKNIVVSWLSFLLWFDLLEMSWHDVDVCFVSYFAFIFSSINSYSTLYAPKWKYDWHIYHLCFCVAQIISRQS